MTGYGTVSFLIISTKKAVNLMENNATESFKKLDQAMEEEWKRILESSMLFREVLSGSTDRRLYALYLAETIHYTSHNARNQAAVVLNIAGSSPREIRYMKFCLKHALDEAGHELMAYHDLKAAGFNIPLKDLPPALPATETLVAYLYRVATTGNPIRRVGYSYYAEDGYRFFGHVMQKAAQNMRLTPAMMTFYVEHSEIDAKHSDQVKSILEATARDERDWKDVEEVLRTSLRLTGAMLDDIYTEFLRVKEGKSVWNPLFERYSSP
jgi:hypothetical protein